MFDSDAAESFLRGRLAQERRAPLAVLKAYPGRWRGLDGAHVLAVTDDLLWLACPSRLLGPPSIACVPLSTVSDVAMDIRRAWDPRQQSEVVRLVVRVGDTTLRYTALDDAETCRDFVSALRLRQAAS